jgi:hypothetical protein
MVALDFGCTSPSLFRKRRREHVALRVIRNDWSGTVWANRAFTYDLNGDGRPEYIVPLQCGAVGNCNWGIFTGGPLRLVGNIPAEYLYIRRRTSDLVCHHHVRTHFRVGIRASLIRDARRTLH